MAQHEEIVLWLDRRWKNAIEKHLKGETLQEHLETVLDELCNQLPQREYERISREIYAEDAANREAEEAARTYLSDFFVRVQDGVGVVHFSRDGEWNIYGLSECFLRQNLPTFDAVFQPL